MTDKKPADKPEAPKASDPAQDKAVESSSDVKTDTIHGVEYEVTPEAGYRRKAVDTPAEEPVDEKK